MSTTLEYTTQVKIIECGKCSRPVAYTEAHYNELRRTHATFYCTEGHPRAFRSESDEERLRKQLNAAELEKTRLTNQLRAEVEQRAKDAARIAKGVCPCCNRTFKHVQRHMKGQHPEYGVKA